MQEAETREGQEVVDLVDLLGVRDDRAGEPAGGDRCGLGAELGAQAAHDPVDLTGEAVDDAGQVDGIVRRLRAELGADTATIATGGLAGAIVPYTEEIDEVDDLLTLTGLRLLHERNST